MVDLDSVNGRALVILLVVAGIMSTGVVAAASIPVSDGVVFETNTGLEVTTGKDIDLGTSNPFLTDSTLRIYNVDFESQNPAAVTVEQYTGEFTKLSGVDTNGSSINIDPPDKNAATLRGNTTTLSFSDGAADDGKVDMVYSASGPTDFTAGKYPANTRYGFVSGSGEPLGSDIRNVFGTGSPPSLPHTFVLPAKASKTDVYVVENHKPIIKESTASPTGPAKNRNATLSIDVADANFNPGDEVDVEFFVEGSKVGSDTLTSNGTASTTITRSVGGQFNWSVEATDAYSPFTQFSDANPTKSGNQPFTASVPASLQLLNISNTSDRVTTGNATVIFRGSSEVVERSDSNNNGNISFNGLPINQQFEATISADGYVERTITIPALSEQETAYLLPDNKSTVTPRFVIDSAVGKFPERSSTIVIQREVEKSGGLEFATITSASPGVSGLDVVLEKDARYRLTIKGENGATRQLGGYQATATEQVTLEVSSGTFEVPNTVDGVIFETDFSQPAAVTATVRDADVDTASVVVSRRDNGTVILDKTVSGNLSVSTPAQNETQYIVNMTATLQSGKTVSDTQQISSGKIATGAAIDSKWQQLLAMVVLLIVAGLFTRANAGVGAISTASIGGVFWYIGWLGGVATGLAVVVALLIGILAYAKQKRGGVPT